MSMQELTQMLTDAGVNVVALDCPLIGRKPVIRELVVAAPEDEAKASTWSTSTGITIRRMRVATPEELQAAQQDPQPPQPT